MKAPVVLDSTVEFLLEQILILEKFGTAMPYLLLKPMPDGRIAISSQDQRGFVVLSGTSLKPLGIEHPARLDNLGYLRSMLELVRKNAARGKSLPMVFQSEMASDQKTIVIKTIEFHPSERTVYTFNASDPFRHRTLVRTAKITEWPVEVHLTPAGIEQFEDASRTHLAGALKSDDFDYFRLLIEDGSLYVSFSSRAGKVKYVLGQTKAHFPHELIFPISTFRSVLSSLGPDGGILKLSENAICIDTETVSGLYTWVMTKKILR